VKPDRKVGDRTLSMFRYGMDGSWRITRGMMEVLCISLPLYTAHVEYAMVIDRILINIGGSFWVRCYRDCSYAQQFPCEAGEAILQTT